MKKLQHSIIMAMMGLFPLLVYAQSTHNTTTNVKASATLAAVCTISAQNVNFGQISLPIGSQTATSSMTVECTKGSPYTIALTYGGIYGGQGAGDYWIPTGSTGSAAIYTEYNSSGQAIGSLVSWNQPPNSTWNQSINSPVYTVNATYYGYGKMVGSSSGDSIAYAIQVPNQPSEVWNAGNYNYTSTGTGVNQTIPVVATLVPSQTTDTYPAADTYLDTVTATITY
jgi:spore coat protein U-like protein